MMCRRFPVPRLPAYTLIAAAFAVSPARAQETATPTRIESADSATFHSHGIGVKVTQASVSKAGSAVNIVAVIMNDNDYDVLVALVSKDPIAIDNKGNSFQSQNFAGVNGISTCAPDTGSFPSDVKTCLDPEDKRGLPVEAYTTLSAGAVVPMVMTLGFHAGDNHNIGDAISFSAVMVVRKALSVADLAKPQRPPLPPATVVTVGVSLAPLVRG
jgi:hypothetical protein